MYAIYGGVYVDAVRKAKKVWRAELSLQALTSYVPFVNMVAQTHNALADKADARPQLALTVDHESGHQLRWTPPA